MQWPAMSRNAWMLEWTLSLRNPSTRTTWFKSFFKLLPRASLVTVLPHLYWAILNPGFQMTSRSLQHDLKCPRSLWGFFSPVDYDGLDTPVKSSSDRLLIQPCLDIMSSPVAYLSECISQEDILWHRHFLAVSTLLNFIKSLGLLSLFPLWDAFFGCPHVEWNPHQALVVAHTNPKRTLLYSIDLCGGTMSQKSRWESS